MIRLFVGLSLPDDARTRLAALGGGIPNARWVEARNLHVTLRFIGEVDEGLAQEIHETLNLLRASPFDLSFNGFGTFGRGHPNHLWVGVDKDADLIRLQSKIDTALVRLGLPSEGRKFMPHLTLARLKAPPVARVQDFITRNSPFHLGPYPMDSFILFRSHLGRSGAEYEALADYPLD